MNCPYCNFKFQALLADAVVIPETAPVLCSGCGEVSLIVHGEIRKPTADELYKLKSSPNWIEMIEPMQHYVRQAKKARTAVNN